MQGHLNDREKPQVFTGKVLLGGFLFLCVLFTFTTFFLWRSREDALNDANDHLEALSKLGAQHAEQTLNAVDIVLTQVLELLTTNGGSEGKVSSLSSRDDIFHKLTDFKATLAQIDVLSIADTTGKIVLSTRHFPTPNIVVDDREYFNAYKRDPHLERFLSAAVENRVNGQRTFYLTRKITNADGDYVGIAIAGIQSFSFSTFYQSVGTPSSKPSWSLATKENRLMASYPEPARIGLIEGGNPDLKLVLVQTIALDNFDAKMSTSASRWAVLESWRESTTQVLLLLASAAVAVGYGTYRAAVLARKHDLATRMLTEAQAEAERAQRRAESADKAKSEFLACMSHEIRTPLNGVLGMTELLMRTPLQPVQARYAKAARASGETLLMLLNNVLDLSKLEADATRIQAKCFSISSLLDKEVEIFRAQAHQKGVGFDIRIDPHLPEMLYGDPIRIRQITTNLLSNAVKYTDSGAITFEALTEMLPDDQVNLIIKVVDSGIGMDEQAAARLFTPFFQAEHGGNSNRAGTGLGLAISRKLASLMSGSIEFQTKLNSGSVFKAILPVRLARGDKRVVSPDLATSISNLTGFRALIVEDNEVNALIACAFLQEMQMEADTAGDGFRAVEYVKTRHYDIVLMDCQMPGLDGMSACRLIRAAGFTTLPIVALTARAVTGDREECIAAGMNDYLTKPFDRDTLEQIIVKNIRSR